MNYIITKSCNKGCTYCFAHESRISDSSSFMSIELFEELLKKDNSKAIKLLGGEPTQHPQFEEIIKIIIRENRKISLISNFLFNDKILNVLTEVAKNYPISFLVNATNIDEKNRLPLWSKNYNTIYNEMYKIDREEDISIGLTLENNRSTDYYINYINFILNNVDRVERLRMSINFPGSIEDKKFSNIINNKEIGNKFLSLTKFCLDNFITPSLDCVLYPCLFNNKEEYKFIHKFMNKFGTICSAPPSDLFPDKTVSYCYPLKESIKIDYDKYNNAKEASTDLKIRYSTINNLVSKPQECLSCNFFKSHVCEGPGLCFYDLSEINIGKNL